MVQQSKTAQAKKLIAFALSLAMILTSLGTGVFGGAAVSYAAAENENSFAVTSVAGTAVANLAEKPLDLISLTEARSFEVKVYVDDASEIDASQVTWKLERSDTAYISKALFPNQSKGGALEDWETALGAALFSDVVTTADSDQNLLTLSFSNVCYWGNDPSAPHNVGGSYLDCCGYFNLNAYDAGGALIGGVSDVKIVPYDSFHTMDEIYDELDEIVSFASGLSNIYVEKFSMGKSSGVLYDALDMPYLIIADKKSSVNKWLDFAEAAESDPDKTLSDIEKGVYDNIRVPVMFSNIHPNEIAATDGVLEFAKLLVKEASIEEEIYGEDFDADKNSLLVYDTYDSLTAAGTAELAAEMGAAGEEGSVAIPELIADKTQYLGYITGNPSSTRSAKIDKETYYEMSTHKLSLSDILDNVFFVLVPEENVEGRSYDTRVASNGYDLNRDNSFQTTPETANMQKLIGEYNPVSLTEFHGRIRGFQVEPCDPPHEPNFEYDLLANHLVSGGEALGIAATATNDSYNSFKMPQRDYLVYTGNILSDGSYETYWEDPWDDMSTSYTPQFAMLHGTVAYTVELPAYSEDSMKLVKYGCLGQSAYIANEKLGYIKDQVSIFSRGVNNKNSDAYELVGQWFANQYDVEGAEAELFRPEYDGENQNGNFYPECYIIPLDSEHQKNLQGAYDMMEWLARNDVKINVTKRAVRYNGTTYPAGTMVVSMYQAKRSVANGALYDGTLIQDWTILYSEGITSFAATRGFDMAVVAEPSEYNDIAKALDDAMDYDDAKDYISSHASSAFSGSENLNVIIKNNSFYAVAAVNKLLKGGYDVGLVTDEKSDYYGDFITLFSSWRRIRSDAALTGIGISSTAKDYPKTIKNIEKSPKIYIVGTADATSESPSGFIYTSRTGWGNDWNYDRVAMEKMGFDTVSDPSKADIIAGVSPITNPWTEEAEQATIDAIEAGTPYISYGADNADFGNYLFGDDFESSLAGGEMSMDALSYVVYPNETLYNASQVESGDDMMYGFGASYYSKVPSDADVLVQVDSEKEPTEGFLVAITDDEKKAFEDFKDGGILAFSYEGKDAKGKNINVAFFANSLTHKGHQTDEYQYISNFAFANSLSRKDFSGVSLSVSTDKSGGIVGAFSSLGGANLSNIVSTTSEPATLAGYSDVTTANWYYNAVKYMVDKGYMNGYSESSFGANDNMTRAQLVSVLYRIAGNPEIGGASAFSDVSDGLYYSSAVAWASAGGIVTGFEDGSFKPGDSISREQLATIVYRYATAAGKGAAPEEGYALSFADTGDISGYAAEAMLWCCKNGILQGDANGLLNPKGSATRAQVATILQRFDTL